MTPEAFLIIVFHYALESGLHVLLPAKIVQVAYVGHVLSYKLVHKASRSELKLRDPLRIPVHIYELERLGIGDLVLIILAVEQILVHPPAALVEKHPAFFCKSLVIHGICHTRRSLKSTKVPEAHLRVRTIILDIHRIVLLALHHSVLIAVPASFRPCERENLLDLLPVVLQEVIVT